MRVFPWRLMSNTKTIISFIIIQIVLNKFNKNDRKYKKLEIK